MAIPNTALIYLRECKKLNKRTWLSSKHIVSFDRLQLRLQRDGINPEQYIETSVVLWEEWAQSKGMIIVPINVICGDKAIKRFKKLDPISLSEKRRGMLMDYIYGAAEYMAAAASKGLPASEAKKVLSEEWYPAEWDTIVSENRKVVNDLEKEAAILIAASFGIPIEFFDVEHVAEQIYDRNRGRR